MKLSRSQLQRFTKEFEIKAKSIILKEEKDYIKVIMNNVIIFNVRKELVSNYLS